MSEKSTLLPTPLPSDVMGGRTTKGRKRQNETGLRLAVRGSSPAVFPASHSVVPGSEEARRMTVSSGLKCSALCRNSGPIGCLVRMLLASSTWRSTIVLLRWKVSATPRGRLLFRLAPSTPRTDATGCGLWPTPVANDDNKSPEAHMAMKARMKGGPRHTITSLQVAAKMWPTVKGSPSGPDFARANREGSGGDDLATAVARMLPTPRQEDSQCIGPHQGRPDSLSALTKMLPTAKGRDWKGQSQRGIHAPGDSLANGDRGDGKPIGGQLNPTWVEWLMGYPPGWTDLSVSETP